MTNKPNMWRLKDGKEIFLLTIDELKRLPENEKIISIMGEKRLVKEEGLEPPDDDTRYGYTAWAIDQ